MARPKGSPKLGGRQKGTVNKTTATAREAIAAFIDGNVERLNGWLDQIAEKDPDAAFKAFMSVVEYNIPKLARTEMQALDKNGNKADNVSKIVIEHVGVKK